MNTLMLRVANEPGLCSKEDIKVVHDWLVSFNEQLKLYKSVYGEPAGLSVDSRLDGLKWYLNRD